MAIFFGLYEWTVSSARFGKPHFGTVTRIILRGIILPTLITYCKVKSMSTTIFIIVAETFALGCLVALSGVEPPIVHMSPRKDAITELWCGLDFTPALKRAAIAAATVVPF